MMKKVFFAILFACLLVGSARVVYADPFNSGVIFYYIPTCTPFCYEPVGENICANAPDMCAGLPTSPAISEITPVFTSGGVFCKIFSDTTGNVINLNPASSDWGMITPDICNVTDTCNSPAYVSGGVCRPGEDDRQMLKGANNTLILWATPIGGVGATCGGYAQATGQLPMTCCSFGYPSAFGVCPPPPPPPPPTPSIGASWTENNSETITKTLTPGQDSITVDLKYWNSGQSGSVLKVTRCTRESANTDIVFPPQSPDCPSVELTAP